MSTRSGKKYTQGTVPMNKVVKILNKDPILKKNWSSLARQLKIPQTEIVSIQKHRYEDSLHAVLELWISRRGQEATIKELVYALNKEGLMWCKEQIKTAFDIKDRLEFEDEKIDDVDMNIDGNNVEEIGEEATEPNFDDQLESICNDFSACDVEEYDIVVSNAKDPENRQKDDDFINHVLKAGRSSLIVKKTKRVGNLKPKQLKIIVNPTNKKMSNEKQKEIARFVRMVKNNEILKQKGIVFEAASEIVLFKPTRTTRFLEYIEKLAVGMVHIAFRFLD